MFDIDEYRVATLALNLSDDGKTEGCFTRRLWTKNFDNTTARKSTHT